MKSKSLNIVATFIVLGFLGLMVVYKKKKNANTVPEKPASKTKTVNNTFHSKPQTSEMDSGYFTTPEDWVEFILRKIVDTEEFASVEEILEKIVIECNLHCETDAWMEKVPVNVEEVEELLRKYSLYEKFVAKMYNSYRERK